MAISINGSTNVITGVAVGGLPDGIVDADMLAANAVNSAKIADDAVTDGKLNISGEVKAWVHFRGTGTVTILANFNVSSITDNATGDYTINFSNALPDANYCAALSLRNVDSNGTQEVGGFTRGPSGVHGSHATTPTASAFRIDTRYGGKASSDGADYDFYDVYCAFIR